MVTSAHRSLGPRAGELVGRARALGGALGGVGTVAFAVDLARAVACAFAIAWATGARAGESAAGVGVARLATRVGPLGRHPALRFVEWALEGFGNFARARAGAGVDASGWRARATEAWGAAARVAESRDVALEARAAVLALAFAMILATFRRGAGRGSRSDVRVVLVTGGSGGLGSLLLDGIREAFPGAIVYGTSRNGVIASKFTRQSSGFFGRGTPTKEQAAKSNDATVPIGATKDADGVVRHPLLAMDVTNEDSVRDCINAIVARHGKIDVVVNNVGVVLASWGKQTPRADADMIMQTNFLGAVSVIRHAMPHLAAKANIINIGSIAGRVGIPFQSLYSASKAALMVYTDALRIETKGTGIKVSLVEPGDLQLPKGATSLFKSANFDSDPVATRAEQIMRQEEEAGTNPTKVVAAVVSAIKSSSPRNRYMVGPDAWLVELLSRVSSYAAREYFLASHYRVPPRDKAWIRV